MWTTRQKKNLSAQRKQCCSVLFWIYVLQTNITTASTHSASEHNPEKNKMKGQTAENRTDRSTDSKRWVIRISDADIKLPRGICHGNHVMIDL